MPKNQGKGGGQPTKYRAEYNTNTFLEGFYKHCDSKGLLISLCGLAVYLNVCEDTLQEWGKVHLKFSLSMEKIKQLCKQSLINKGLTSKYNANLARFCLSANHGMTERTETLHGVTEQAATLLGLIDGNSKGKLPSKGEEDV